jgi:hypothetical protein
LIGFESTIVIPCPNALDFHGPKTTRCSDVAVGNVSCILGGVYVTKVELSTVVGGLEVDSPQRFYKTLYQSIVTLGGTKKGTKKLERIRSR